MVDLINKLTEQDKILINNYISQWGVSEHFIGIDQWLQNWSHSKQKLYQLLGNKFIYSQDFSYQKNDTELRYQIRNFMIDHPFYSYWKSFISYLFDTLIINTHELDMFFDFVHVNALVEGKISPSQVIKIKKSSSCREFRLQPGTRTMRAIGQTLKYFKEEVEDFEIKTKARYPFDEECQNLDLFKMFEDFRVKHSILVNDKNIKGKLYISIHPLDFMTMSDNDSNWSSCMSWENDGCYHVGTIEMMNSNNVLCCYISSHCDFNFANQRLKNYKDKVGKDWNWNNKKWRQLVYITKDIVVGGKAYPFQNLNITETVLKIIRKLAKNNLNWTYKYGIEPYKDMKYIKSIYAMDRAAAYAKYNPRKKNILFASNGMYNDMIADHYSTTKFLCCRNTVKKTKIINYSGKANCLCCNGSIITEDENIDYDNYAYYEDRPGYNDRYVNVNAHICPDCRSKFFSCEKCHKDPIGHNLIVHFKTLTYKESNTRQIVTKRLCAYCASSIKKCPDCGEPFEIFQNNEEKQLFFIKRINAKKIDPRGFISDDDYEKVICCQDCIDKLLNDEDFFEIVDDGDTNDECHTDIYVTKKEYDFSDPTISKYFFKNVIKKS